MFQIERASRNRAIAEVQVLFREYQAALGIDLEFQHFAAEVAGLPGSYAMPRGRLLLARHDGQPAGCVALQPRDDRGCEMKRLYVRVPFRGSGLGRLLAERVIAEARAIGYTRMYLDTLPSMSSAQRLYEALGFRDVVPYRYNPVPGTRFMAVDL